MKQQISLGTLLSSILFFAGCTRIIDYGNKIFYQVETVEHKRDVAQKYVRSLRAYNQLSTACVFDALWLTDPVRALYSDLRAARLGKNEELTRAFLRRQYEENRHYIQFYLLSVTTLGESDAQWTIHLNIDGEVFRPIELKKIEIAPEYTYIFGKVFNHFKTPYMLKFNAKDIENKPLITDATRRVALVCRSVDKEVTLEWNFVEGKLQ